MLNINIHGGNLRVENIVFDLNEEIEKEIFSEGLIFFDTSVLLDFYFYSDDTIQGIFTNVFPYLKHRLWITDQVNFEFTKNKSKVLLKPIAKYDNLLNIDKGDGGYLKNIDKNLLEVKEDVVKKLNKNLRIINTLKEQTQKSDKHPYLTPALIEGIEEQVNEYKKKSEKLLKTMYDEYKIKEQAIYTEIDGKKDVLKEKGKNDQIYREIKEKFKLGRTYNFNELMKIAEEGEFRYNNTIPPGYEDSQEKIGLQRYGDLFVWKQILEICKKENKSAILISNDIKEDWNEVEDKDKPRSELIREFAFHTQKQFWKYTFADFLFISKKYLNTEINETIIEDVTEGNIERNHVADEGYQRKKYLPKVEEILEYNFGEPTLIKTYKSRYYIYEVTDIKNKKKSIQVCYMIGHKYGTTLAALRFAQENNIENIVFVTSTINTIGKIKENNLTKNKASELSEEMESILLLYLENNEIKEY